MKIIRAYEFLEMTDELFGKFTSTVGGAVGEGKNIRYKLETKQTLHDFIKKCKDGKNASLMNNHCDMLVNKCRYYLYPEKRITEYTLLGGESVESVERFSERCIGLFFRLTGVDFNFLRVDTEAKKAFSSQQKKSIETLFRDTIQQFKYAEGNQIAGSYFITFIKLEYVKFRYELLRMDVSHLANQYYPFRSDELAHFVEYTLKAHQVLNSMFLKAHYQIGRDETLWKMKNGFKKSTHILQKLIKHIQDVSNLEGRKKIKELFETELKARAMFIGITDDNEKNKYMQLLKDLNVAEWKNKYIQLMLDRKYSDYLCIFVQSVMFVGNYKEALGTMENLCEQTLDILKKIEITNLERDSALIELILSIHEMYMFLTVQPTKYYDPKTDSLDFGIIDDEDPAF